MRPEKAAATKGRHEVTLKAARDPDSTKAILLTNSAAFSEANGGLFRYEDFAEYTAEVETPVSRSTIAAIRILQRILSASQGPAELIALLNLLEGYDLESDGPKQR